MAPSTPKKTRARPEPVAIVSRTPNNHVLLASPVHTGNRARVSSLSLDGVHPIMLRKPSDDVHVLTERHWRVVFRTLHVPTSKEVTPNSENKYKTTYRTYLMLNDDLSGSKGELSAATQAARIQGDSKRPATPRFSNVTKPNFGITTRYRTYSNLSNDENPSRKSTVYQRIFVSVPPSAPSLLKV